MGTAAIITIIILLILAIIIGAIIVKIFTYLSRGLRSTKNIIDTVQDVSEMLSEDQSVAPRQIQNLTNTYEAIIRRDFPEFDYREFLTSAENTLLGILNGIESGKVNEEYHLSHNLKLRLQEVIKDISSKNEKWYYDNIFVHKSGIARYTSTGASKIISIEIALQYSFRKEKNARVIYGNGAMKQYKYALDAVYIQDISKFGGGSMEGHKCPNCGAPVKAVGEDKYCQYCGTGLKEINTRIWEFDNYKQC